MSDLDKKYPLRLDTRINFKNLIPHFYISDNETSDFFIKLTNDNEPVEVENIIVAIAVINPNEKLNSCFLDTKSEKGLIYCNLPNQLKNVVGAYKARIMCISGNDRIISNTFEYKVDEDEFQLLDEITEGSDELIILSEMLSRLSSIEQQEDDRKANEEERKANELARQEIEAERVEAEEVRKTQEAERRADEADRKEAETRRVFEENARQATEKTRVSAENQRTSNENARKSNENIRVTNENARLISEKNRQTAETERLANEKLRKEAEVVREDQEAVRQANEKERQTNETKRIKNEEKREKLYEDSLNLKSEIEYDVIERDKAEAERVANEEQRVRAEQQRAEDYRNRQQAELDRIANERTRQSNEQTRISNENARKNNESIRISGENLRSNAENARKQAEKDRVQAEAERKARETNMLNNEIQRQVNEGERIEAEESRKEAEAIRIANEADRVLKESANDSREAIRQEEENKRLQAELDRQNVETERRRKEQIRIENEEARVSNETLRVANEDERLAKEAERQAKETERITAENARIEAENTRLANEIQRKEFIDGYEGRLEYVEEQYTNQDDRFTRVEDKNKEQDARIKQLEANNKQQTTVINGLLNLHGDGNLCIEDDGNDTNLVNSIEGKVQIDNLTGNTMVNSIKNSDDEYTLNGDINVSAQSTTLTNAVDNGQVDILAEGNTMVNVSKTKDEAPITKEYAVDVASEVAYQGDVDGKARVKLTGHTLVNVADELNDVTTSTEVFTGSDRSIPEAGCSKVEIVNMVGNTMVNSIKNPDDEFTLNADINTSGQSVTLTTAVDNGQVDVLAEGNTMVNVCDQQEAVAITKSYTVETGNHVALQGEFDGKARPVPTGNTLVNLINANVREKEITTSPIVDCAYQYLYQLKPNTTYTLFYTLKDIVLPTTGSIKGVHVSVDGGWMEQGDIKNDNGDYKFVFTTTDDTSKNTSMIVFFASDTTGGSGKLSNVMILEGDYTNKPIPDYFTGMQSSFEDKVVPENLVGNSIIDYSSKKEYSLTKEVKPNTTYTVFLNSTSALYCGFQKDSTWVKYVTTPKNGTFTITTDSNVDINKLSVHSDRNNLAVNKIYLVEGDYTNYDFSDYDPTKAGKYRVDYKVTGKNKININKLNNDKQNISIDDNKVTLSPNGAFTAGAYYKLKLKTDNQYTLSCNKSIDETFSYIQIECLDINDSILLDTRSYGTPVTFVAPNNTEEIKITVSNGNYTEGTVTFTNIQLEEGSTATAYEPYKESIKTYYLNSPLLEGDTIEESGGNVYHVHRSKQEIFNGDETFTKHPNETNNTLMFTCVRNNAYDDKNAEYCYSDKFISKRVYNEDNEGFYSGSDLICFRILKSKLPSEDVNGFKSYISQNPTTVVYKLSSPQYELISQSDTILTDSYVAGHLDFDTAVPVEKVSFKGVWLALKYWYPSTEYNIQFESDNIGKLDLININGSYISGNVVKGINKFTLTTPSSVINNNMDMRGIGFSASNIVVTEATDKEFGYFAGMKSVGELEENKIEILSQNKNLLDMDNITSVNVNNFLRKENGKYIYENTTGSYGSVSYTLKLKPNTKYVARFIDAVNSENDGEYVLFGYSTPSIKRYYYRSTFTNSIIIDTDKTGIVYCIFTSESQHHICRAEFNFQLEEGDTATDYIPHAENKKQILLNEPLRAVGDTKDRFVQIDGKWYVERNCNEVIMNSLQGLNVNVSDILTTNNVTSSRVYISYANATALFPNMKTDIQAGVTPIDTICDKLPYKTVIPNMAQENQMAIGKTSSGISLRLYGSNIEECESWLNNNPLKITYVLTSPTYEPVEIAPTVNTYTDVTHITNNSTIPMNMNIKNSGYEIIAKPSTKYTVVGIDNGRIGNSTIVNGTITTPATITDNFLRPYGSGKTSKVMLLEGEPANIPSYFKGIKSVFEDKVTEDGKYAVEVKVVGKNKFDKHRISLNINDINEIETGISVKNRVIDISRYIEFDPNKQYIISWNCKKTSGNGLVGFEFIYEDGTTNFFVKEGHCKLSSDINKKISRIKITFSNNGTCDLTNIQLEEGTVATEYEPYHETKQTLYLDEPLYNTNNITIYNDKLGYWKNWDKVVLDGSEDENLIASGKAFAIKGILNFDDSLTDWKEIVSRIKSNYKVVSEGKLFDGADYGVGYKPSVQSFRIRIPNINTIANLRQYLSQNPVTVVYQLAEPVFVPVLENTPQWILDAYDKGSIHIDTIVPPKETKAKYLTKSVVSTEDLGSFEGNYASLQNENDGFMNVGMTGRTMVNVCSQKEPVAITKSYTVETGNHVALQGEFDGKARPVVHGNTLVNLHNKQNDNYPQLEINTKDSGTTRIPAENGILSTTVNSAPNWFFVDCGCPNLDMLKPNTVYSIIFNQCEGVDNVKLMQSNATNIISSTSNIVNNIATVTTKSDFTGINTSNIIIYVTPKTTYPNTIKVDTPIILEGDYTNKPIPDYFTGMQSSFEDKVVTQEMVDSGEELAENLGKYRVDYKVTGKNKCPSQFYSGWVNDTTGKVTVHPIGSQDNIISSYIKVTPYTNYVINSTSYQFIWLFDENKNFIKRLYGDYKFNSDNASYIIIGYSISSTDITESKYSNIQIEEGTTTTYEPYKEHIKTYYLNSPLLEGDTIEESGGNVYHVHRGRKSIYDGSDDEGWKLNIAYNGGGGQFVRAMNGKYAGKSDTEILCGSIPYMIANSARNAIWIYNNDTLVINSATISDIDEFKTWLQANPATIVYQLVSPTYEVISQNDTILTDSYVAGHLDFDTAVPIEKVKFNGILFKLKYWYPSTNYIVQFEADDIGKIDLLNINGNYTGGNIVKGLNKFTLTTPSTVVNNYMDIYGIGCNISNIVVTEATDKDFGYFSGMKSSYEDKYNEVIGKYEVNVKVVGKNKVNQNLGVINSSYGGAKTVCFPVKPNTTYIYTSSKYKGNVAIIESAEFIPHNTMSVELNKYRIKLNDISSNQHFTTSSRTKYIFMNYGVDSNIQIEEGTVATEYEPYHEEVRKVYLNSPLLEGDEIVVKGDGLYHKHNYSSIVLDGNGDGNWGWNDVWSDDNYSLFYNTSILKYSGSKVSSNKLPSYSNIIQNSMPVKEGFRNDVANIQISIATSKLSTQSLEGFKQWLSQNPITAVYKLASPTYEKISDDILLLPITAKSSVITETAVPVTSINNNITELELRYLYANKPYTVQFISDRDGTVNIDLGGMALGHSVVEGLNTLNITTPATHNKLVMTSGSCKIRELVIVDSTEPNIKYFTGLESSYENGIVELTSVNANGEKVTKTYELTSPLLEGDTLEEINGVPYHVHRWNKIVLDGTGTINDTTSWGATSDETIEFRLGYEQFKNKKGNCFTDSFANITTNLWTLDIEGTQPFTSNTIDIRIKKSRLSTPDVAGFRQWLQQNPVTVIYQLASPTYEELQETLQIDSYVGGKLVLSDTNVPLKAIGFNSFKETLTYLYPNTSYNIQFNATATGKINITLGGTAIAQQDVVKGLNKFTVTTPETLVDNCLVIDGIGINISEVVVTQATTNEFGYFEGMKSVGELEENKIEILSRNKNLCSVNSYIGTNLNKIETNIKCKKNTIYTLSFNDLSDETLEGKRGLTLITHKTITNDTSHGTIYVHALNEGGKEYTFRESGFTFNTGDCNYISLTSNNASGVSTLNIQEIQIEEGNITSYILHAENKKEILLNEPLRSVGDTKDRFVQIDGKWYIERNTIKLTYDGNDSQIDWRTWLSTGITQGECVGFYAYTNGLKRDVIENETYITALNDNFPFIPLEEIRSGSKEGIATGQGNDRGYFAISINKNKLSEITPTGFNEWLKNNPITIVAIGEPVYEPIEIAPTLNTYTDVTHLSNNSTIPMTMNVKNSGYECIIKPSTQYTVCGITSGKIGTSEIIDGKITTPSTITDNFLRPYGSGKASKVMLLEGNVENIPEYFKGIKSVFEDKVTEDGKYAVEVKVVGKNKFDVSKSKIVYPQTIGDFGGGNGVKSLLPIIKLKPNTSYICKFHGQSISLSTSFSLDAYICSNDKYPNKIVSVNSLVNNKDLLDYISVNKQSGKDYFTFTTDNIHTNLFWGFNLTSQDIVIEGIQLEEGTVATEYEPYKETKQTLYLDEPLYNNNVMTVHDNKLGYWKNWDKIVLDGSDDEIWEIFGTREHIVKFIVKNHKNIYAGLDNTAYCLSDKFPTTTHNFWANLDYEQIALDGENILFSINKIKATNVSAFRQWLSQNPVTVVYQLAEPVFVPVIEDAPDFVLESFENCSVHINSNIPISNVKYLYSGLQAERIVEQTITDNVLTLTKDKLQTASMSNNTTINLPSPLGYTEIHLFFVAQSDLVVTCPSAKWSTTPNLSANKTYEFIFLYINESVGWLAYVREFS